MDEQTDICCLNSLEGGMHKTFATVLTKSEIKDRPDAPKAIQDEIQKFKNFDAFEKLMMKASL